MDVLVGNIYSTLVTTEKKLIKVLREKYSARVPGCEYSPQYRKGFWDGKTYYVSEKGKFRSGLLDLILKDLDQVEIDYNVKYIDAKELDELDDYNIEGVELRDYQDQTIRTALEKKRCVIESPTAAGKTIMMACILKALGSRQGVIFFNQKQILVQTYDELKRLGFDVGIAFGEGTDIKNVTLCTVQSIEKIMPTHLKTAEFIMVDEVHEFSKGKLTTAAIGSFPNAEFRMGFTATIPKDRLSKLNLISRLGGIVDESSVKELIDQGWLSDFKVQILDSPAIVDPSDAGMSYTESYDKYIIYNEERNKLIKDLVTKIRSKGSCKILIITKNLAHAKKLNEIIDDSLKLEGIDDITKRKETIKDFISKDQGIIIGTKIFQTGINIPEITHLINARGLKSEVATIQALGRALRLHKSKKEVYIYDFYDKAPYLEEHSKKRVRTYKNLKR